MSFAVPSVGLLICSVVASFVLVVGVVCAILDRPVPEWLWSWEMLMYSMFVLGLVELVANG